MPVILQKLRTDLPRQHRKHGMLAYGKWSEERNQFVPVYDQREATKLKLSDRDFSRMCRLTRKTAIFLKWIKI